VAEEYDLILPYALNRKNWVDGKPPSQSSVKTGMAKPTSSSYNKPSAKKAAKPQRKK
jgi:hypothetical protein